MDEGDGAALHCDAALLLVLAAVQEAELFCVRENDKENVLIEWMIEEKEWGWGGRGQEKGRDWAELSDLARHTG